MKNLLKAGGAALVLILAWGANTVFAPFASYPDPARVTCLPTGPEHGEYRSMPGDSEHVIGMGLTYSTHMKETAAVYTPGQPPVFFKGQATMSGVKEVQIPAREQILSVMHGLDPDLSRRVRSEFNELKPLLDYEVEMGLVLLEDVSRKQLEDPNFAPRLGFFIANDLSVRTLVVVNEKSNSLNQYLGAAKSFPGFLPSGSRMWVPNKQQADSQLCIELTTRVNGKLRQKQSTQDLTFSPRDMLRIITRTYPDLKLKKNDLVITGTPGGIALQVPGWKQRLGKLFQLSGITRLKLVMRNAAKSNEFLKAGDRVTVSGGELLGESTIILRESGNDSQLGLQQD